MSVVSTAYDTLLARIVALFPVASGYRELTNPYDIQDNTKLFLNKGWGMSVGPVTNTNLLLCKTVTTDWEMRVVLSRELASLETDAARKHTRVKELLEDMRTLLNDFDRADTLETIGVNILAISTNGIETVRVDNATILYVELIFTMKIFDPN